MKQLMKQLIFHTRLAVLVVLALSETKEVKNGPLSIRITSHKAQDINNGIEQGRGKHLKHSLL